MNEFNKYMAEINAKREAFNKEMTLPLVAFLTERYGSCRVVDDYVYVTLPEGCDIKDFLVAINPYVTCNTVTECQGRVGIRLNFC